MARRTRDGMTVSPDPTPPAAKPAGPLQPRGQRAGATTYAKTVRKRDSRAVPTL